MLLGFNCFVLWYVVICSLQMCLNFTKLTKFNKFYENLGFILYLVQ